MAQEPRRDQPVRLPNPSAQPFVAALKTARLFAVIFFWITMACILSYVVVFILTEWIGLYDAPLAPAAPVESKAPAEPKGPAAPPREDAPAPEPGSTSWLGLFENTAQAATKKNGPPTFFGQPATRRGETPPEGSSEESAEEMPEVEAPPPSLPPPSLPPVAMPKEETEGKVIARPETPPAERRAPTLEEQRERAQKHYDFTLNLLKPLRVIGVMSAFLLGATLFLYLQIALLGRLSGIRQLANALFMLLLFLASVLPWDSIFDGFHVNAFYDFTKLMAAHAARLDGKDIEFWKEGLFYIRFFFLPLISVFLLAWSGIQFASGYGESVVANE